MFNEDCEDWDVQNPRVVLTKDADGNLVKNEVSADVISDAGAALFSFMNNGDVPDLGSLVKAAILAKVIEATEDVVHRRMVVFPAGDGLQIEFSARKGATQTELDLACFRVLCQKVLIEELPIAESETTYLRNPIEKIVPYLPEVGDPLLRDAKTVGQIAEASKVAMNNALRARLQLRKEVDESWSSTEIKEADDLCGRRCCSSFIW